MNLDISSSPLRSSWGKDGDVVENVHFLNLSSGGLGATASFVIILVLSGLFRLSGFFGLFSPSEIDFTFRGSNNKYFSIQWDE